MKKGIKITLITAGVLLLAGGALYLFFGGLPLYLKAQQEFPDNDAVTADPYPHADLSVPADYSPMTFAEWTVSAPVPLTVLYKEGDESELRKQIFTGEYGENGLAYVCFMKPDAFGALDLTAVAEDLPSNEKAAKDMLNDFAESLGRPGTDWYSLYDFSYRLRSSDCKPYTVRRCMAFYTFAYLKDQIASAFAAWDYHTDNADGFVLKAFHDEESRTPYGVFVELFPKSDRNTVHTLLIKASDEDTLYRMVNSARLDPSNAEGAES